MAALTSLMAEFECPVCMEYMCPPIHQCLLGHTFCAACFEKFEICPTCRCQKGSSRAYALERIHANVMFPCKYRAEGCYVTVKGSILQEHHDNCLYASNSCPFANALQCQWTGQQTEIVKHCKEMHPANVQTGNHVILKCPMFELLSHQSAFYFTIIVAYGEKFEFCWKLSPTGCMKWSVYFLGKSDERKRYKYKISIGKPQGEYDPIVMGTSCEEMIDEMQLFEPKNCLTSTFESTKKRCNKNGDLHYEVRIIDKAFETHNNDS